MSIPKSKWPHIFRRFYCIACESSMSTRESARAINKLLKCILHTPCSFVSMKFLSWYFHLPLIFFLLLLWLLRCSLPSFQCKKSKSAQDKKWKRRGWEATTTAKKKKNVFTFALWLFQDNVLSLSLFFVVRLCASLSPDGENVDDDGNENEVMAWLLLISVEYHIDGEVQGTKAIHRVAIVFRFVSCAQLSDGVSKRR